MDAGKGFNSSEDTDDIQAQVLQTTLAEIQTSREDPVDLAEHGDCCVICLDCISEPGTALPCGHAHFDFLCLVSWLQEHPNCPLCKANVYKVRYADAHKREAFYRVPNAPRTRDSTRRDERAAAQSTQTSINPASRTRFSSRDGLLRETGRRCPPAPPTPNEAIQRRRHIYRHQLYSLHIGSNRISQYRSPPTPIQFSSTPHLISRARLWIRRELQVFSFLSDPEPDLEPTPTLTTGGQEEEDTLHRRRRNNAEFLLEYIVAILKTVDLQGSAGQAEAMLADFLGRQHARLFLHELRSWLRSPAQSLERWDREVQYPDPSPVPEDCTRAGGSGTASDRSSRAVSDGGDEREEADGHENVRGRAWRDRGGDHWRAETGSADGRRKRRRRGDDDGGEGRVSSRLKRDIRVER